MNLLAAIMLIGAGSAWADRGHGHVHFGIIVGPQWGHLYYPPPYYYSPYYPPVVIAPPVPQVYIEQQTMPPAPAAAAGYWYYCAASGSYYPYIKECPGGWQKVLPQPPQPH
jgi:hypothetical protein